MMSFIRHFMDFNVWLEFLEAIISFRHEFHFTECAVLAIFESSIILIDYVLCALYAVESQSLPIKTEVY